MRRSGIDHIHARWALERARPQNGSGLRSVTGPAACLGRHGRIPADQSGAVAGAITQTLTATFGYQGARAEAQAPSVNSPIARTSTRQRSGCWAAANP